VVTYVMLFTARERAIRTSYSKSVHPSVRLPACLSHAGIVSK